MKTKTYNTYSFNELSPKARERAKQKYAAAFGFTWSYEYLASLKALAAHFGGKVKDYQIDWFNNSYSSASFDMPDDGLAYEPGENAETEAANIAAKLAELGTFDSVTLKGHGDCKLTGFCADESAIDGFRAAWNEGECSLEKLMQAAFKQWLKDAHADCESQYEDEQFAEHCESNGYEFTENGEID